MTDCTQREVEFQGLAHRRVVADFGGGDISSDGGALLLRDTEQVRGWIRDLASCFTDYRDPELIEHTVAELLAQRVFGLALGYEDLNDHDQLRVDPLLAVVCGKSDPMGAARRREADQGKALAGKSTLHRLEHGRSAEDRYKKIVCDVEKLAELFVKKFISRRTTAPAVLVLDLDATDDPVHGEQEGRFFHGYYDGYCYLPLYIFCGSELLCAKLRPANIDASAGSLEQVERIVQRLRGVWPDVRIVLRADSGFARDDLMSWCETHGVDFVFGLSRNRRLEQRLAPAMAAVQRGCEITGATAKRLPDSASGFDLMEM